jgi:translation elongation factor EF-1beta
VQIPVVGYGFMLIQGVDALQFKVRLGDDNDSKVDRPENLFEQIIEWRR